MLPPRLKTIIFATVLGAVFMSTLDVTIVATALPDIIAALGGFQQYAFVATAYLIGSVVAIPITGKMIDIYGRKWFYIGGLAIFVIGSLLSGLSRSMVELIIFRSIQGVGAGVMIANAFTVIGDMYPPSERGKYQSYISIIFGVSSIIGPLVGGFLTDYVGWEWIFYINVPIGIVIIVLFMRFLPLIRHRREKERIDYPGIALLILAIVPLLMALSWGGGQYPWLSPEIIGMLCFSVVMGVVLYFIDRNNPDAIMPFSLFRNQIVSISIVVTFLLGFAMYAGIIFVPLWFQGVQGESATASGSYLTPMMLGLVAGAFFSGQALTRLGGHYRLQGIIGIVILAVGMWLLTRLQVDTTYILSVIYMVTAGIGLGITFPLYSTAIQNVIPLNKMGVAISSVPFWRFMGGALGLAILGSVVTNTFAANFLAQLPASIKNAIPASELNSLIHNPHGLIAGGHSQISSSFPMDIPSQISTQILDALRYSLNYAITHALFISLIVVVITLVIHIFIRQIPLRRTHVPDEV
jgi:EmrB/QacA subfamily drug resistance transporter